MGYWSFSAILAEVIEQAIVDFAVSIVKGINDDGDDEALERIIEYLELHYPEMGDDEIQALAEAILDGM